MLTLLDINKKSLESQRKIYKALRQLLLVKPLADITVTDVSELCDISRSTFYRNFNNVIDILYVFFDFYYERYLIRRTDNNTFLFFFEYWNKHKDLVSILTNQAPSIIPQVMNNYFNKEYSEFQKKLKIDLFTTIISRWSISKVETPEEMERFLTEIFSKKTINLLLE